MKKQEIKLSDSDFEIFESYGRRGSAFVLAKEKYPKSKLVSIGKNIIVFDPKTSDFLKIEVGTPCVLAKKDDIWYLAVLPFDSNLKGYLAQKLQSGMLFINLPNRTSLEKGVCEINEPQHIRGIDWYELEYLKIDK